MLTRKDYSPLLKLVHQAAGSPSHLLQRLYIVDLSSSNKIKSFEMLVFETIQAPDPAGEGAS